MNVWCTPVLRFMIFPVAMIIHFAHLFCRDKWQDPAGLFPLHWGVVVLQHLRATRVCSAGFAPVFKQMLLIRTQTIHSLMTLRFALIAREQS